MVFNEGALKVGYNTRGSPHSRIREHKVVQAFDVPMLNYNTTTPMMAEAFSFNPGMLATCGLGVDPESNSAEVRFFKWYHQYKHYQTKQRSLAEVAFYLDNESLTFSQIDIYMELCALTQLLQEERLPFNFIYRNHLDDLSQYRLIIAAGMHCLPEAAAAKIADWVRAGGRLLTTGRTGTYDECFRLRTRLKEIKSLADLRKAHEMENVFTPLTGEPHTSEFIKQIGAGMAAHIPKVEYSTYPDLGLTSTWMVAPEYINRPANSAAILSKINALLPERRFVVTSDKDVAVDLCRRKDTGEGLIHIFNISFLKGTPASAWVEVEWMEPVASLTWIGYDRNDTSVKFTRTGKGVCFSLDGIRESAVVVINKKQVNHAGVATNKG